VARVLVDALDEARLDGVGGDVLEPGELRALVDDAHDVGAVRVPDALGGLEAVLGEGDLEELAGLAEQQPQEVGQVLLDGRHRQVGVVGHEDLAVQQHAGLVLGEGEGVEDALVHDGGHRREEELPERAPAGDGIRRSLDDDARSGHGMLRAVTLPLRSLARRTPPYRGADGSVSLQSAEHLQGAEHRGRTGRADGAGEHRGRLRGAEHRGRTGRADGAGEHRGRLRGRLRGWKVPSTAGGCARSEHRGRLRGRLRARGRLRGCARRSMPSSSMASCEPSMTTRVVPGLARGSHIRPRSRRL
jgi:hypothetical protein